MQKGERKRLVLFDAHAIIHRAYHALPDFTTKDGEPTGGLYGLTMMLLKAIEVLDPDYMAACYDLPGPTFRHKEYTAYKAGRAKADDELKRQLETSREVFLAFHIPIYDSPGFEADDMLGTIVEQVKNNQSLEVVIVTGDMDSLQLVSGDRIRVFTLKKGLNDTVLYDEKAVNERFGFGPEFLPDYKGFRGDPSDNIIGIKGIGEKTAGELIQKFGSVENIYLQLKKDKSAMLRGGIKERIIALLEAGEDEARFSKMLATIRKDAPIQYVLPETTWREHFEVDTVLSLMERLEFRTIKARIVRDFSHSDQNVAGSTGTEKIDQTTEVSDPEVVKHTCLALWLLDSDRTNPSKEECLEYTGESTFLKAKTKIFDELKKTPMQRVYEEIELPLISIIDRAQSRGILVDRAFLEHLSGEYHDLLNVVTKEIYKEAKGEFNINSPKQLGEVLFDRLQLTAKGLRKTEGGARSTRESELEKLRDTHPIIGHILKYREIQKLLSTYIDVIPGLVDVNGRLHTTFHQSGTTTGRMSSSNPNLQNIPVREGLGAPLRNAFISSPGKTLLAFDYAQIEMRVLAMLSQDPGLIEIFQSGTDVHTSVASKVFRVPQEDVTKEMRRKAKVINFGIIYGMGVNALRTNLQSTKEEAQEFYDQYFVAFPKIAAYFERVKSDAASCGYTETLFGRRRQFRDIKSKLPYVRAQAERMAMNAPVQGTAADFVKIAMREVDAALKECNLLHDVELLLQVHDELIFEITDTQDVKDKCIPLIKKAMEDVTKFGGIKEVRLLVEPQIGKSWGNLMGVS